jgi:hypothetical protein
VLRFISRKYWSIPFGFRLGRFFQNLPPLLNLRLELEVFAPRDQFFNGGRENIFSV